MATSYAAFTSLMHLISDLKEHPFPPINLDEEHVDYLNSMISFFQKFLEDHHTSVDLSLELRLADAAYAAEDVIDTRIAERVLDQVDFNASLRKAMEAMDLIEKEVMNMSWNTEKERSQGNNDQPRGAQLARPDAAAANSGSSEHNDIVVGMEDLTLRIVDKLTLRQRTSGRQIISVKGMGGIGKTTLAGKVYDHKCIVEDFDVRSWATISKDYNIHESLVELVRCLHKTDKETLRGQDEQELGLTLYQYLCGRRYLIILDDLWDVEAWDTLQTFFPDKEGSGIVITSRESNFDTISSHVFKVGLLDESQCWDLFCKTVFGQDDYPWELEDVGRKISDNCGGLPLSVVVIGGHLAKSPRTQEYWESIAKKLSSIVNSEDDGRCLKILSLSYIHLPVHLKPCFLYMGIFPEDKKIIVPKLISLWVAEGFLKPVNGKSLEEAAQEYLSDLASRNLILVSDSSFRRGELFSFKIHDLLRDLCLKEALEKKFYSIMQNQDREFPKSERRVVLYPSSSYEADRCYLGTSIVKSVDRSYLGTSIVKSVDRSYLGTSIVKSLSATVKKFICFRPNQFRELTNDERRIVDPLYSDTTILKSPPVIRTLILHDGISLPSCVVYKSLRVLASVGLLLVSDVLVEFASHLVNLRCLRLDIMCEKDELGSFPSSILNTTWNLQSFSTTVNPKAPLNIWKLSQLRRIFIWSGFSLSDPPPLPSESHGGDMMILKNLQSAEIILNFRFSEDLVSRIPNIRILHVRYDEEVEGFSEVAPYALNNIALLEKLEMFDLSLDKVRSITLRKEMSASLNFPNSLKSLWVTYIQMDDKVTMSKIGSLPLLEELTLYKCSIGREWTHVDGQFVSLKYLNLTCCHDLERFAAESSHFPCLEELQLSGMYGLEEISSSYIGNIQTLKLIKLSDCRDSAVISAKEIADFQKHEMGNEELRIEVELFDESCLSAESLSDSNFIVSVSK